MKKESANTDLTLKEKILYSILGIGIVGGGIFFGRKIILKKVANREENKSFEDGTPATYAKQLKMAFDNDGWWGTDMTKVRSTLMAIPSKQIFIKVQESYKKLYNSNLVTDLSDELQTSEYDEMLQIIAQKPDKVGSKPVDPTLNYVGWAKRLKAAFDKEYGFLPGTDDNAIQAVINEIPTQKAFVSMAIAYKKIYGTAVLVDLKSESQFGEYDGYLAQIIKKPKG